MFSGGAEALVKCGGKLYHLLIAYFLGYMCAKYDENPTMLFRVIAKNVGNVFLRHTVVTRGHFRSRDKDGSHTNGSTIVENPMLHANFMTLCCIELELLPIEVLHCGNRRLFCSCDLVPDTMTFMYELYPYPVKMYRKTKNELLTSRLSKVIVQTDRHTPPRLYRYTTLLRG